jgi:pyrroloquinoline quinone biosynthesis protein E
VSAPDTLVAELTYACPLKCGYCSNPVVASKRALSTAEWTRTFDEAAALGVLQLHLTGGEPLLRDDLEVLVAAARRADLYVNLITSGVGLTRQRLAALIEAGVDHVQLSFQAADATKNDALGGVRSYAQKREVATFIRELGVRFTLNVVLHRGNIDDVEAIVKLGDELGADRLELANTQYLGSALANRDALLPSRAQLEHARDVVERSRAGRDLVFVLPDYLAGVPRACMGGWAARYLVVTPDGTVLPCHAAAQIPLPWERIGERTLAEIWDGPALARYRGHAWMSDTCKACDRRDVDFGGCRCQAFALTGDAAATDPVCPRSPDHALVTNAIAAPRSDVDARRRLKLV